MKATRPLPTGEYKVGTRTFTVNTGKKEILDGHTDEIRRLSCRIWYPADAEDVKNRKKAEYMNREQAKAMKQNYEKRTANGENVSECYPDAAPAEGKFPLVIYNHGYTSFKEQNSFLCLDLVSHGYVVVTLEHPYEASVTVYDDGTVLKKDKKITKRNTQPFIPGLIAMLRMIKKKGTDEELFRNFDAFQHKYSSYMFGRLDAWAEDTDIVREYVLQNFADMIDLPAGVGLTGHSFGGDTAYALCRRTDHYKCGINIDGGLFGEFGDTVLRYPFMNITSEENYKVVTRCFLDIQSDVYSAVFKQMKHLGFTDLKFAIPVSVGKLPPAVMHTNLCKCHLMFFDKYLKGQDVDMKIQEEKVTLVKR